MSLIGEAVWDTLRGPIREAIGPAFGALFGAYFAFALERWRDKQKEKKGRADAVRRAQAALRYYARGLTRLWEEYLAPLEQDEARWRKLCALAGPSPSLEVAPNSLTFLVDLGNEPLLSKVVDCHSSYSSVLTALEERRAAQERFGFAWSRVPADIRGELMETKPEHLEELLGPTITEPLRSLTNALYQGVPVTLSLVRETDDELEQVIRKKLDSVGRRWL